MLIVLFALWANTHIAMILGLGWLGGWIFIPEKKYICLTVKTLLVALLGTCLTPYGIGVWLTFFSKINHVNIYRYFLVEFAPVTPDNPFFPCWLLTAFCFAAVCFKGTPSPHFRKAVTTSFLLLGLYAVKFIPFALIASLTFISLYGHPVWGKSLQRLIQLLKRPWSQVPSVICWILALILCSVVFGINLIAVVRMPPLERSLYPERTLDFVFEKKLPGPFLMIFGRGG